MRSADTPNHTGRFLLCRFGAEIVGLACGGAFLSTFGWLPYFFAHPGAGLLALAVFGGAAGVLIGGLASALGEIPELSARRGARAAMWAAMTGAVCLVLAAGTIPGSFAPRRALMVMGAALVPAMFAGAIAATLAAVWFRRHTGKATPIYEEPTFLSGCFRWLLRSLLFCGVVAALSAPFRPTPFPVAKGSASSEDAPPPFRYTTPEALKTAPPVAWKVSASRGLGTMEQTHGWAFSHDHKFVAGITDNQSVTVRGLESDFSRRLSPLPAAPRQIAFSPDGKRMFFVFEGEPRKLAVAILETGRIIPLPQPKRHAVPDGIVLWDKENSVSFIQNNGKPATLDLLTLELDPLSLVREDYDAFETRFASGLPGTSQWWFRPLHSALTAELPETDGINEWSWKGKKFLTLSARDYPVSRYFTEVEIADGDRLAGVPDGSKILRFHNDNLTVFYFDTRPPPPLRWSITLPHGPERMRRKEETQKALKGGELRVNLYSPLINPLTEKTIGPDREKLKTVLRVWRWEGTEAELWIETMAEAFERGDVLADFNIPETPRTLLEFDQPHRWWTVAPEPSSDSADITKLPTNRDVSLRRNETIAKERPESQAATITGPDASPLSPDNVGIDDVVKTDTEGNPPENAVSETEVRKFVTEHHRKISEGKVAEMVADYATKVDHFKNGIVTRDYILKDELAYHRQYTFIHETIRDGAIRVQAVGQGWCEARYIMENEWRMPDGRTGRGAFVVTLGLERQPAGWRIINQRSEKLN